MAPLQLQKTLDRSKVLKFPHFDTLDFWFGNNRCRWPSKSRLAGNIFLLRKVLGICLGGKHWQNSTWGTNCAQIVHKSAAEIKSKQFCQLQCCCASIESNIASYYIRLSSDFHSPYWIQRGLGQHLVQSTCPQSLLFCRIHPLFSRV
jgi:hypothetical protein